MSSVGRFIIGISLLAAYLFSGACDSTDSSSGGGESERAYVAYDIFISGPLDGAGCSLIVRLADSADVGLDAEVRRYFSLYDNIRGQFDFVSSGQLGISDDYVYFHAADVEDFDDIGIFSLRPCGESSRLDSISRYLNVNFGNIISSTQFISNDGRVLERYDEIVQSAESMLDIYEIVNGNEVRQECGLKIPLGDGAQRGRLFDVVNALDNMNMLYRIPIFSLDTDSDSVIFLLNGRCSEQVRGNVSVAIEYLSGGAIGRAEIGSDLDDNDLDWLEETRIDPI